MCHFTSGAVLIPWLSAYVYTLGVPVLTHFSLTQQQHLDSKPNRVLLTYCSNSRPSWTLLIIMKWQLIFSYKNVLQVLFSSASRVHPTHITHISHSVNPALIFLFASHPSTSLHFHYTISVKSTSKELTCQMHQLLIITYALMHSSIHLCFRTSIHPTSQLTIYSHTQQSIGLCMQPSKQPSFPILASN
jgi:hypothetical protein